MFSISFVILLAGCGTEPSKVSEDQTRDVQFQTSKEDDEVSLWFKDVTSELEIDFVNSPDHEDPYFMPNSVGSGAAAIDVNKDGLLDLYCLRMTSTERGKGNQLYEQQPDGKFVDKSKEYGLGLRGYFHGVGVGDLNNDGFDDLILTEFMGIRVLINLNGKGFKDITPTSGVANDAWGMSVSLTDYDADGWLDIVVANYVKYIPSRKCNGENGKPEFCGPQNFGGSSNRLFRNRSKSKSIDDIKFEDTTNITGVGSISGPSLGVTCLDFTGDGLIDFFFADDMTPNCLFVNQGDGQFKDEAVLRGIAVDGMGQARADMGIGIADVDRNGFLDVFVTHLKGEAHTLWAQGPKGVFMDSTLKAGLAKREWQGTAFGTVMADFDLDGWTDVVLVNGGIRRNDFQENFSRPDVDSFWKPYAQRAQICRNVGEGRFEEINTMCPDLTNFAEVGRGLLAADFNNDGGIDLVSTSLGSKLRMFENVVTNRGAWLGVSAILPDKGGRTAVGASIEVFVGKAIHKTVINSGYSYLCSNDDRIVIGLGIAEAVDDIVVTWPDLSKESFRGIGLNRYHEFEKGAGMSLEINKERNDETN